MAGTPKRDNRVGRQLELLGGALLLTSIVLAGLGYLVGAGLSGPAWGWQYLAVSGAGLAMVGFGARVVGRVHRTRSGPRDVP